MHVLSKHSDNLSLSFRKQLPLPHWDYHHYSTKQTARKKLQIILSDLHKFKWLYFLRSQIFCPSFYAMRATRNLVRATDLFIFCRDLRFAIAGGEAKGYQSEEYTVVPKQDFKPYLIRFSSMFHNLRLFARSYLRDNTSTRI